jgi:RHS repeat-associated protein
LNYATDLNIHLRSLIKQQQVFEGMTLRARTSFEYDNYTADTNHAGLVNLTNISGLDAAFTTSYSTRGNPTASSSHLINTSGQPTSSISTYAQFDIAGNVVKSIDARGYASLFEFADRFGTPDGNAQANSGATELGSQVSYSFATKITNSLSHLTYSQFDYYSGHPVDTEDTNGIVSSLYYNDPLDRPSQVRRAVGTSVSNQTSFNYDDANRVITTTSDLHSFNDNVLTTKTLYDGLGRTKESRQYEGGTNYIATQTQYDALNRPFKTSNPFRPWKSETPVWTTQAFDALGRVTSVMTPDNAVVSTTYSGNTVTVTDAAGKSRKSATDALGRLIEVYEDPTVPGGPTELNFQTTYAYDVLDNLVKVTQGTQQRFFMYDSLKRLIRARNPEQGTLASLNLSDPVTGNSAWSFGYQYDANSNLTFKTDPRGTVTENRYDALNRVTTVLYRINGQPDPNTGDVEYLYDNATNGKGRLWLTYKWGAKPHHTAVGSYDAMGRITQFYNLFGDGQGGWSAGYEVNRTYNRAGSVTSQTYPSGRSVTYNYDNAGRLADKDASNLAFTGNLGDGTQRSYASGITYSSWGSLSIEKFGTQTPLYHKLQYNIRGQLWDVRVATGSDVNGSWNRGALQFFYDGTYGFGSSGPDNNGNLLKSKHYVPLDDSSSTWAIHDQLYTYDSLNRLASMAEHFVSSTQSQTQTALQTYSYDRWGNRNINAAQTWGTGINNKVFAVDTATNRLGVPVGQTGALSYDNAGNLTTDTYTGAGARTYDAENKMVSAADNAGQTSRYTYSAAGHRTRRQVSGGQEEWQIYGIDGELLAEYPANGAAASPQKEYGYRNGQLLLTAEPGSDGGNAQNVSWTNAVGVLISGNNLTRSAAGDSWSAAGATSSQTIESGDGYVEITATETNKKRAFGLTTNTSVTNYTHNAYGMHLSETGQITIHEGILVYGVFGNYTTGDKLRVSIEGGVVKYRKNGALLRTSTLAPTYPLRAGAALYTNGSTVSNVMVHSAGVDGLAAQLRWLVPDHLGTPRIILDRTGNRANVKRHDYLPFGEELFGGSGGRTTALGYAGDGVRQQFTSKERDVETGLDYFGARYYSSIMGRFASCDEPFMDSEQGDPQSWNRYPYVRNNPSRFSDPTGQARWDEIDGERHWVGDVDGEYDEDLGATWVAVEGNSIGGYWDFGGDQSPVIDEDAYYREMLSSDNYSFEPPGGGGLRIAGGAARASRGLVGRFISWAFKRGGSGTVAGVARPVTGQLFERTLQTSKGPVNILAEVVVEGDKLVLKDIAIYGQGSQPLTGLTREILAATSQLKDEVRALGFKALQITGKRALTSTSRNPGHEVNVTIRLE